MTRASRLSAELGGGLTLLVGVVLLRLAASGLYLRFLRAGMFWPLVVAGALFVLLGGWAMVQALGRRPEPDLHSGHDHRPGTPAVALLLVVPVLAVFLVSPPSLGAFAADRVTQFSTTFAGEPPPLAPGPDGVADLGIADYTGRLRAPRPGVDVPVRMTGFVSGETTAGGFVLSRFAIACCAADARVASVAVLSPDPPPAVGAWVTVVGRPDAGRPHEPVLLAQTVTEVDEPAEPYQGG